MSAVLPLPRLRIGLIIPSSNRLSEPQFARYSPSGVQVHVTRLRMTGPNHVPLDALLPKISDAALTLADARCDLIVFHCTGSSMEAGLAAERRVIAAIESSAGIRATTTASALLAAFQAIGAQHIVLVSPYRKATNEHEIAFLAEAGIRVLRDRALELPGSDAYISAPPELWLQVTLEEADPRAEAYFLSCTNINSLEVIEPLEAALRRPIVASNQATLWYCLHLGGIEDRAEGLGRLMREGLSVAVAD